MIADKKTLLIVDDAAFIRKKLREIIEPLEFVEIVGEAKNGQEAIDMYKDLKPDLVTMDLIMPIMGGIEAIEKIRAHDQLSKIIVISQVGDEDKVLEASEKGALDYIHKPFDKKRVVKVLENLLT